MGKRTKRWRARAQQATKQVANLRTIGVAYNASAEREIAAVRAENVSLRNQLSLVRELECFRVHLTRDMFGRMGRDIYALTVQMDLGMIEFGAMRRPRSYDSIMDPYNLSQTIRYLTQDLCRRLEREIVKQLTEQGRPLSSCF